MDSLSLHQGLSILDASFSEDISGWGPCDLLLFAPNHHDEDLEVGSFTERRLTHCIGCQLKGCDLPIEKIKF